MGSLNDNQLVTLKDFPREASHLSRFDCLLFDLDDTLYPRTSGLQEACRQNIEQFMVERLGINAESSKELCDHLYKTHGSTLAGLRAMGYTFDFDDYHNYAHGRLPYERLQADHKLRDLLLSLPQQKIIFTNADRLHAVKVLRILGIEDCFEDIISFETIMEHAHFDSSPINSQTDETSQHLHIVCKPSPEAMRRAIHVAKVDPSRTLFFDDSIRNIEAGKKAGLHTVLVGTTTKFEGADYAMHSVHEVIESLGGMFEEDFANYSQEILAN